MGSDAMDVVTEVAIAPASKKHTLASTQNQFPIDTTGRKGIEKRLGDLIRETDLDDYTKHPDFAQHKVHHPPLESLWQEHEHDGAWSFE